MNRSILCLFLCIFFISCQKDKYRTFLEIWLSENMPNSSTVLIIPNAGCSGCISSAEILVKEICSQEQISNIKIIFTEINSLKILKAKVDSDCGIKDIIFFDKNNSIRYFESKHAIYPSIIYISNGKIKKIELVSPSSPNTVDNLKQKMNFTTK